MTDRWAELRRAVALHQDALADGGFAAGDHPDYDPDVLAALLAERNRYAVVLRIVDSQRRLAEQCVGSLPMDMGEHFERRKAEADAAMAALTEEADR